jgi:methionyl-tRNA formyltransferase
MSDLRIVFMGTPDFAVESLKILLENNYNVIGVITAPDKPAGRGQQVQESAVKKFAVKQGLNILQPEKLKDQTFLAELKDLKADLQIVVAFRMLPEVVWNMPRLGSFNLHGSLLPKYRGAAPINWAVINGETETGVSTFFLQEEIDTGKIIYQEKIPIGDNETAGEIHDRLMDIGAKLVLKTLISIEKEDYPKIEQRKLVGVEAEIKHAPKIFKDDCRINWDKSLNEIHNLIRGLSPYPTAFTELVSPEGKVFSIKLLTARKEQSSNNDVLYNIYTDSKTYIKISVKDGYLLIDELQMAGKKRMKTEEFLRGFKVNNQWKVI